MEKRYVIVAEESPLDDSYEDRYKEKNIVNYKDYYLMYTDELTEEAVAEIIGSDEVLFNVSVGWYGIIDLKTNKILSDDEERELYSRNEEAYNRKIEISEKFHRN